MNIRIPCLVLLCALGVLPVHAENSFASQNENNAPSNSVAVAFTNQSAFSNQSETEAAPVIFRNALLLTNAAPATVDAPRGPLAPSTENGSGSEFGRVAHGLIHSDESLIWLAMAGVLVVSFSTMIFSWQMARRNSAAPLQSPRVETPAVIVPTLLPVISQAIKEALVQELSAQRRELLGAQQSAAAELSQLARRLEAVQTPLLERVVGLRPAVLPSSKFPREIPVKIFCACGQKYAFEVQPVDGRMPFSVACPACGQDGTHQANQIILRWLSGLTQPLSPNGDSLLNTTQSGITSQLVDAVKQAVLDELATKRPELTKPVPMPSVPEHKNGSSPSPDQTENLPANVLSRLLAEGQSLADAGELEKAVRCLEAALVLQPDRAETLVKLAGVFEKLDRADEALQHYDRAIALDESLTIAYLNKGGVFNRLARYDEALRCYEQALLKQKKTVA